MFSGFPTEINSYNISIVASDTVGEFVETSFLLKIEGELNNGFVDKLNMYTISFISIIIFMLLILSSIAIWRCY